MPLITNPLEEVGVPEWMVRQALQDGPEALERLRRHIGYLVGSTGRVYHPDQFPDDTRRTYRRVAEAAELLKTTEDIEAWGGFLIDPDSLDTEERERLHALAVQRDEARTRALLNMLSVVNPYAVVGLSSACELVFGMPPLSDTVEGSYDRTRVLRLVPPADSELLTVRYDQDLIIGFGDVPEWDSATQQWRVQHFDMPADATPDSTPVPVTTYHTRFGPAINVQLVGAVSPRDVARLYAITHVQGRDDLRALTSGNPAMLGVSQASTLPQLAGEQVIWYPPENTWWLDALQPTLGLDDFGVIMRPTTGELALVGRLLAIRTL